MTDKGKPLSGSEGKHDTKRAVKTICLAVCVAVIAISAGVGARWWQQQREYERLATPEMVTQEASDAQNATLLGDFDKAYQGLQKALDNPKLSMNEKYDLLFQQGLTYENQKKYQEAIDSYKQAETQQATMGVTESIARVAESNGDKDLAIAYFKKAIPLIPSNDPRQDSIKRNYEESIVRLGGRP
jgi:tetratricopeptide (TPR) repeat protein